MSFFDNPKNGAGALATRLATDASAVQGVSRIKPSFVSPSGADVNVRVLGFTIVSVTSITTVTFTKTSAGC
jgi:hypothetical protein